MVWSDQAPNTITIPPGAGPNDSRIVIDNNGIRAYDSSGNLVLNIFPNSYAALLTNNIGSLSSNACEIFLEASQMSMVVNNGSLGQGVDYTFSNSLFVQTPAVNKGINEYRFRFGEGVFGAYYAGEWDIANAQVVANLTNTIITGMTQVQLNTNTNYNTAFNTGTGIWTCPISGYYSMTFSVGFTTWVSGSRFILTIQNNTANRGFSNETAPQSSLVTRATMTLSKKFFTAGDQVSFIVTQSTGANRTIDTGATTKGVITIAREL